MAQPWRRLFKHKHTQNYPKDNKLNPPEGSCSLEVVSATENFVHTNLNIICMKMTASLIMAQERRLKQNRNPGEHKAPQSIPKCHTSPQENAFLRVRALCAAVMDRGRTEWDNAGKFWQPYALHRFNALAETFGFSFLSSKLILKSRGK